MIVDQFVSQADGTANKLLNRAIKIAKREGYLLTHSCMLELRRLINTGVERMHLSGTNDDYEKIARATDAISSLIHGMINEHKRLLAQRRQTGIGWRRGGRFSSRKLDIHSLRIALKRLCPLWPFC